MIIISHFILIFLKNPILKVDLNRTFKNASTCTRCLILQNGLHVNEILIEIFKIIIGTLKNTYVLSNYACYNQNVSKF
jgi:hypothetical protein